MRRWSPIRDPASCVRDLDQGPTVALAAAERDRPGRRVLRGVQGEIEEGLLEQVGVRGDLELGWALDADLDPGVEWNPLRETARTGGGAGRGEAAAPRSRARIAPAGAARESAA